MNIVPATLSAEPEAIQRLVRAFADDRITGFLLQRETAAYTARLERFFSLLMRARLALGMPVLLADDGTGALMGAAMGYDTTSRAWPTDLSTEWDAFEASVPGLTDRMATYDAVAEQFKPDEPHYYLGVIGLDPVFQGLGAGRQLLQSFCDLSAADPASCGVYLETAEPSNVGFYEHAGFVTTGQGRLGASTLWCMYLRHPTTTT